MAYKDPEDARAYGRAWRERNREHRQAKQRERYLANKELMDEQARDWKARNPERQAFLVRRHALRTKYGIGPEDYDRMLLEQSGGCAICATPPPEQAALHVDHDHTTGEVRGLLCQRCNMALGLLEHDDERLFAAATYLLSRTDVLQALAR